MFRIMHSMLTIAVISVFLYQQNKANTNFGSKKILIFYCHIYLMLAKF